MKLLYLNEHLSCLNYQMNSDVGFTCQQLEKDEVYRIDNSKSSCTLFIIEGDVIFDKKIGRMKVQPELAGKTIYSVCRMNDGFLLGTSEGVYFYYVRNENVTRLLLQLKGKNKMQTVNPNRYLNSKCRSFMS